MARRRPAGEGALQRRAITIDISGYWHTVPNTPAGLAQLAAKEADRSASLLRIVADGGRVSGPRYVSVSHEPHADHPHRPWVDRTGHRYSTFEVYPEPHRGPDIGR